jgi:hypothetical protein
MKYSGAGMVVIFRFAKAENEKNKTHFHEVLTEEMAGLDTRVKGLYNLQVFISKRCNYLRDKRENTRGG